VTYTVAENHVHVTAFPGWDKQSWLAAAKEALGDEWGHLPWTYIMYEDGIEDWIFSLDDNMPPEAM